MENERKKKDVFNERLNDWHYGQVVYQVFLDRFAPSLDHEKKKKFYSSPQKLRPWHEVPRAGNYLEEHSVWEHEIEFWGGDLVSLEKNLSYINELGADVVYLNPIFKSFTNHKYDTENYHEIDPQYGDMQDLKKLVKKIHSLGMKIILDGVFNHMGKRSPFFNEAQALKKSKWRTFFKLDPKLPMRYVGWLDTKNLPELALTKKVVQDFIYKKKNSVVQSYLRKVDIDGWRLDVASNIGHKLLADLTKHAHQAKKESMVVGEIWSYPEGWCPSLDGILNLHTGRIIFAFLGKKMSARVASASLEKMVSDSGIDSILKSWTVLDNHDTPRLRHMASEHWAFNMASLLQFTLPGNVCLYYGTEIGMEGGNDPECRAPMRWDLLKNNLTLEFFKSLISLRKKFKALRVGDFKILESDELLAFMRFTNSVRDTMIVLANVHDHHVNQIIQVRDGKLQNGTEFLDYFSNKKYILWHGTLDVELSAKSFQVLIPQIGKTKKGYDAHENIE